MSVWNIFANSLVSPRKIADLLATRKRKAFGYLALLILLCLIPSFIIWTISFNAGVSSFQTFMKSEDVPDFELKNGVLTSDREEPLLMDFEGESFLFDTTGTYNEKMVREENVTFAILQDRIIIDDGAREQQISYAELGGLEFSKQDVNDVIDLFAGLKWIVLLFLGFIIYVFQYVKLILIALVLALIGLVLNASLQQKLPYGRLWVLATFSCTLPTVLSWVLAAFSISIPFSGLIYLFLCSVLLFVVLKELSNRPVETGEQQIGA